jgi:hypothetical protein
MRLSEATGVCGSSVRDALLAVFEDLRRQVTGLEGQGVSHSDIATAVGAILDGASPSEPDVAPVAFRLAWLVTVYAPSLDPVLVTTLPFCLESIVEGYATLDDLFEHVASSEPVKDAPRLPSTLATRSVVELEGEVRVAVVALRDDPEVYERIVARLGEEEPHPDLRSVHPGTPAAESVTGSRSVVYRWPTAVREAVVSVLQLEPSPGAVPLMRQIAGRLDARSVRRLAGELVHVSTDEASLHVRVQAAASLLAMNRSGHLGRF